MANTYWSRKGKFQGMADYLQTLVPLEGSVADPRANPALEKFRKASNVYYDLYNNGLGNRARQFKGAFGFTAGRYAYDLGLYGKQYTQELYDLTELAMNQIVLDAMNEQASKLAIRNELKPASKSDFVKEHFA